jgi:hypothetical protein
MMHHVCTRVYSLLGGPVGCARVGAGDLYVAIQAILAYSLGPHHGTAGLGAAREHFPGAELARSAVCLRVQRSDGKGWVP